MLINKNPEQPATDLIRRKRKISINRKKSLKGALERKMKNLNETAKPEVSAAERAYRKKR